MGGDSRAGPRPLRRTRGASPWDHHGQEGVAHEVRLDRAHARDRGVLAGEASPNDRLHRVHLAASVGADDRVAAVEALYADLDGRDVLGLMVKVSSGQGLALERSWSRGA